MSCRSAYIAPCRLMTWLHNHTRLLFVSTFIRGFKCHSNTPQHRTPVCPVADGWELFRMKLWFVSCCSPNRCTFSRDTSMHDNSSLSSLVGWLFLIANSGRLLAYFPQIIAAARCDAGAKSVSVITWGYFAFAHLTALLYAIVVLQDPKSVWIFTGNLVVTLILVGIVMWKRRTMLVKTKEPIAELQSAEQL